MPRLTPGRLAYLIAALFSLSVTVAIAGARYPDLAYVSVDEANAINQRWQAGDRSSLVQSCASDAPDPDHPCPASHLHNFAARARLIGVGVVLALAFSALGYRRSLDALVPAYG